MNSLKGKIFFILLLSALCIGGIGYYSITNLFELTGRIEALSLPNKKWELFREITTNLHELNRELYSQGLNPSETFEGNHVRLIDSIAKDIDELRVLYSRDITPSRFVDLDTIPVLLEQIKLEFQELKILQDEQQAEVIDNLEEELLARLDSFSTKDSVHIVDRISLEVRSRNIPDSIFFYRQEQEGERRSFFRRLFSRARPPAEPETRVVQSYKTVTDTLVRTTTDTVVVEVPEDQPSTEDRLSGVIKEAFSNYYKSEVDLLEKIRESEIKLYQKSAMITADLERLINELRFEENQQSREQAERIVDYSRNFQNIIIWVIIFFALLSLLLVFMVSRDINKNKEYQLQILNDEEKARREAVAKQEFLTTMSHELRTPLTSIIGYAELLDDSDQKAKSIKSSSIHLLNVANEILDSAKIESGIIETKEEIFDLTALLHQVRDNTIQMIVDAGLEPKFVLPDHPIFVLSDSYRIQQVIYNLIHNAIKFTFKGHVGVEVAVTEKDELYETNIGVVDSGIGIHESNVEMIFENYQQIGTYKNKTQGIGLGLGLVKKVVQQLQGDIYVTSKIGEGSTFHLSLPLKKSSAPIVKDELGPLPKELFKGKRFYCVDDDPLITKLYEMILVDYQAEVTTQNDPKEALTHLLTSGELYDVVITDIKMPEMTGHELLAELKAGDARPKKIIASTANVLLNEEDKQELADFDAYLSKPILKKRLLKTITETLGIAWETAEVSTTQEVEITEEALFDIEDLAGFAMDDDDMLKEILMELHEGNTIFLKEAMGHLARRENVRLGEVIHKLSSRFAQIKVKEIVKVKPLEKALLNDEDHLKDAEELLTYWSEVNHKFGTFLEERFDSQSG